MGEEKEEVASPFGGPVAAGSETRGFAREQMVLCEECRRANAPTRMNCLYCGAALPVSSANAALRRPTLRPPAEWESGFNVILLPDAGGVTSRASRAAANSIGEGASLLRLEPERFTEMLEARVTLPLARVASTQEAALIRQRLAALGFAVEIVGDEVLAIDSWPPARVRRLEFAEDALGGRAGADGEAQRVAWPEIVLLVTGRLFTKRVEVEERRNRLGLGGEVADAREMFDDESVLDLFAAASGSGAHWRITADSFDYSCLGERKTLLARDNFVRLVELLRARAPSATYDEGYARVRHLLQSAWPLDERAESGGLRRERPGKFNVEAVTRVSNETQFTRYARLLYMRERRRRGSPRA